MKILDEKFVEEQLAEWAKEDYPLTLIQELKAKDLFYELMKEKQNANKDLPTQESLLAEIARKLSYGETPEGVFRQHGDDRHLNYFDVFLEQGQSYAIREALLKHNIPTDVLKGIKKNVDFNTTIGDVTVIQSMSDGEDTSPTIELFEIYKDGKLIYGWSPESDVMSSLIDEVEGFKEPDFYYYKPEPPKEQPKTKSGKPRKGTYLATIINSSGEEITKELTSTGKTVYRASNGRFTKK